MNPKDQFGGIRKLSTRMSSFSYRGSYGYHITIHTVEDNVFLDSKWDYELMRQTLFQTALKQRFKVLVYCFMPNHLHLLLVGEQESELKEFVRIFKQITAFHYKKAKGIDLWQRSYFDRVLRQEEDTLTVVKYILENPLRWGLVKDYRFYPYSGSSEFTMEELGNVL